MILATGCVHGKDERMRIANTLRILESILQGQSVYDPECLPSCFRAYQILSSEGAKALEKPRVLWAVMRPVQIDSVKGKAQSAFSLDIAWLSLDDEEVAGLYIFSQSTGQRFTAKLGLDPVDAGTAYSVRLDDSGGLKVKKDLSVKSAMRLSLVVGTFGEDDLALLPDQIRNSAIALPQSFNSAPSLELGLILADGELTDSVRIIRKPIIKGVSDDRISEKKSSTRRASSAQPE